MQSVLRPRSTSDRSHPTAAPEKKLLKQRRSPWRIHWGSLALCTLGLWLLGGVAWWQYQWWQPTQNAKIEADSVPVQRIADFGGGQLR